MKRIFSLFPGALLLGCAMLAVGCAHLASLGRSGDASASNASGDTQITRGDDGVARISPKDAMKEVADGKAVVIDVRGTDSYKLAHVKDALDHALARLESNDVDGLPKNKRIIPYCT